MALSYAEASCTAKLQTFKMLPMLRNCICICGAQIRAPVEKLKRGMGCPVCGQRIVFEEQFGQITSDASEGQILDFSTKESTFLERIALLPGWIRFSAVILAPLLLSMLLIALLRPTLVNSIASLSFSRKSVPPDTISIAGNHSAFDWSQAPDWNTSIDPIHGSFEGSQIAKEFAVLASASQYESIEKLFAYDKLCDEVLRGRNALEYSRVDSRDAVQRQLRELVSAFLDNSQRVTPGYHDWRLIGVSKQEHKTALLMRYYRENTTPVDLLDNEEILLPLTRLVRFDSFKLYCDQIFRVRLPARVIDPKFKGYLDNNFFADKSFGYVVLMVSGKEGDMAIEDLLDYQVQRPLSQLCMNWAGASDQDMSLVPTDTRPLPGPSETDLRSIQDWIRIRADKFRQIDLEAIRETLSRLYHQTKDPLIHDMLGRLESDSGDKDEALGYFRKARASGFKSLESHRHFIKRAIESNSPEYLIEQLHDLNNYWNVKLTGLDAEEDPKRVYKFEGYWRRGEAL